MLHECKHCHGKASTLKMCAACSMVRYCNSECQKKDWPIHLVDCNPGRPITTADRLVACAYTGVTPEDKATFLDYGFAETPSQAETLMRLEAYRILIVDLQVKAKTIHHWLEEGKLGMMMRETFDAKLSPDQRQKRPYQWFCDNQSTFGRHSDPSGDLKVANQLLKSKQVAWAYMGGNPSESDEIMTATIQQLPEGHLPCFYFVAIVHAGLIPSPGINEHAHRPWVWFGFCACVDPQREDLMRRYAMLFQCVRYSAFHQAYLSSSLPKLLADNGLAIDNPFILDVLSSRDHKSVWYLKEFVYINYELARVTSPAPCIRVDYGFGNCRNAEEVDALRNAYKQVFMRTDANPLELHDACLRGELFEYVGRVARLKPAQLFKQLMKNPYPL